MKIHVEGLGRVALFFCLILFMLGAPEAKSASYGYLFSHTKQSAAPAAQQDVLSGPTDGVQFEDALHSLNVELAESHNLVRKLPLVASLLCQISLLNKLADSAKPSDACLFFSLSKDLSVSYRNLRI